MQEIIAPMRDEAITPAPDKGPRRRKRRWKTAALLFVTTLGLGWAGGLNTQRLAESGEIAAAIRQTGANLQATFDVVRKAVANRIANGDGGGDPAGRQNRDRAGAKPDAEVAMQAVRDLLGRLDDVHAASEASMRDLSAGVERVRTSTEQADRDLMAELRKLGERLDRLEQRTVEASAQVTQSAAPAVQPTAPPLSQAAPPARPGPKPAEQAKPGTATQSASRKPSEAPSPANGKLIANWTVRDVLDGRAILVGPRGTVKVAQGESLPDIGQVQAIIKSGQRWIVSTTKGVIPPR